MDLEPRKPNSNQGANVKRIPVKKGKRIEDAGEPLPKRILRSASKKLPLAALPTVVEVKKPKGRVASTLRKSNGTVIGSKDNAIKKKTKTTETVKPNNSKSKEFSELKNTKKGKKTAALSNPRIKTVTGANAILPSKNNTPVGRKFTFLEDLPKIEHFSSLGTTKEESMQERKNPMLLNPVIRCIFGFLDLEYVKNCRFVSREWSSVGKQALTSRALIRFRKCRINPTNPLPIDFSSCFPNSAARFSSFEFFGGTWTTEELSKFFDEHQKSIKELTFTVFKFMKGKTIVKHFDISPYISKSPMVKKDAKYLTKLAIHGADCAIPLHLLKHIKHLSLTYCRVNLEPGIQIHPVKLLLRCIDFYQDGTLSRIQINDIVNFDSAKEIDLEGPLNDTGRTEITINFGGNCSLESLNLLQVEVLNWETSNWNIESLRWDDPQLSPTQMTINELYLSSASVYLCDFDLFFLPKSIQKLGIGKDLDVTCSEPIALENLEYLTLRVESEIDFSYLTHFRNCRQLAHLKFRGFSWRIREIKLPVIPEAVKTLILYFCSINWDYSSVANVEKIISFFVEINFEKLWKAKISVHDIIMICNQSKERTNVQCVANFIKYQKRFSFCKRFYIGGLNWYEMKFEDSVLNEHVDTKSAFYVFENGEKGRALDEKSFYQLADIPKRTFSKHFDF